MKKLFKKSMMVVLTMVMAVGLGVLGTPKMASAATNTVTVTNISEIGPGGYTLTGSGFNNAITTEVYDANWNRVPIVTVTSKSMYSMTIANALANTNGRGVILFFDASHNQIGGSVISLYIF